MEVTEKSFEPFQPWPDTTVWPDMAVETIGIRPISNFENPIRNRIVNSSDILFNRMKSTSTTSGFTRVIGGKCEKHTECNSRVPRSHCSYGQRCECLYSFNYDKLTDSCYRVKSYNERCTLSDGCHNILLRCSEFGLCTCHHGYHYEFGKSPYCQPNNSSACDPGQTWDPMRARCVRPRIHTLFTDSTPNFSNGGYDRNRYSLFFSVVLILVLMVILFKSKKSHPFTWDRRSRRMSRSISYAEALGYAFGVRSTAPNSHPSHIIPPPHQGGPFDVSGEYYDWNPHSHPHSHHHHHVVHHPHLQSLVVTMPGGAGPTRRDGNNSIDTVNSSCHLISDVIGMPDATSGNIATSIVNDTNGSRLASTGDSSTACIPPPPYASTLSLATACATINDSSDNNGDTDVTDTTRSSSRNIIFSNEKPPTYEEAIRYDTTLLPVATDVNNNLSNNSGTLTCNNGTVATCVPGNCRCNHLPCGQNSTGFICLSNSPASAASRCHSVNERNVNGLTGSDDMSDRVPIMFNRSSENVDPNSTGGRSLATSSSVVVNTTQHCTNTSHVPYLTPPVHSLPFSARLREYPYPVSPWPVSSTHGSSSSSACRSERHRLHRSSRPMNYGRSHTLRRNHGDASTDAAGPSSSFISLLRRGTSFMAIGFGGSRNRSNASGHQSVGGSQLAGRSLSGATDHIRPNPVDEVTSPSSSSSSSSSSASSSASQQSEDASTVDCSPETIDTCNINNSNIHVTNAEQVTDDAANTGGTLNDNQSNTSTLMKD